MDTRVSRRGFLSAAAATSLVGAVNGGPLSTLLHAEQELPAPAESGIEHVVLVMMENRSFDHFLGWLPHANGRQAGLSYPDKFGVLHPTYHLTDYQGCALADPDHSYQGARAQYDNGKCDGWLRAGTNDLFPIGYYGKQDLSFMSQAAPYWTTCDNYFAGLLAPTYPNRFYQHSAQTDRLDDSTTMSTLPTIWDRLANKGLTGRYFYNDIPFTALWGATYQPISRPFGEFLTACAAGTLPQVSYIDPRFEDEDTGTSGDDHPHGDIRNGEAFLNQVYNAVRSSPAWRNTVLIINFDEWGGFFDHVAPPLKPIPPADAAVGSDGRIGFRVPALVISPFARRSYVAGTQFDHTSVLKLIEWRWNLDPLSVRDAGANNLASVLNFDAPNLAAPEFAVPTGPFGTACTTTVTGTLSGSESAGWLAIKALALQAGFILP
ncbi:MAG: alkaline phosphatase family protein [Acidobacteriaceae bacterium]